MVVSESVRDAEEGEREREGEREGEGETEREGEREKETPPPHGVQGTVVAI